MILKALVICLAAACGVLTWELLRLRRKTRELEKQSLRARRASDKRSTFLNSLIDNSPLAIVVLDDDARVRITNAAFEKLFQYRSSEILGQRLDQLILGEEQLLEEGRRITQKVLSGQSLNLTTYRYRKDRTPVDVELHGVPLVIEDQLVGIFALYQDITERVRAEQARLESEERLRRAEEEARQAQKMDAVGRLAGGIAHDFNNLLTVILGRTAVLGKRLRSAKSITHVDEIRRAAEQASVMTQRLLAFGRKQPPAAQVVDLNDVLRSMERMLRRLVRADIDLIFDLSSRVCAVKVDPGQMEQVVLNLVINAADAMPEGGVLTLRTTSIDLDDTGPHWSLDGVLGPQVLLEVEDNGVGMDAETRERVFEPFFTTKEAGKGTGLGLSTVYAILQQNQGSILLESAPSVGSTFRIYLPLASEPPEPPVAPTDDLTEEFDLPEEGTETILVVEDEPGVRRLAVDFLTFHGYNVIEAEDGRKGFTTFQESPRVDLVLTDIVMPGMNGPELAKEIAAQRPEVQILFMSGYDDGILEDQPISEDLILIHKPFTLDELIGKVREALSRS